jgi:hypothetical protein
MNDELHTSDSGGRTEKSLFKSAEFARFEKLIEADLLRLEQRWSAPSKTRLIFRRVKPSPK